MGKSIVVKKNACTMSLYQDQFNKRIRLDEVEGDFFEALRYTEKIAREQQAEKLIIKGKLENFQVCFENGFICEAKIDHFFQGEDLYFFCKYYDDERRNSEHWIEEDDILQTVQTKVQSAAPGLSLPSQYELREMTEKDADAMALLYRSVFEIYPVPLNDADYIRETMNAGTVYYGIFTDGAIVSAAAAEIDEKHANAEMTDCATLPQYRKHQFMKILLLKIEEVLRSRQIYCAYSIARALSFGMNASLHTLGYEYRGRLANNCYIFNKLEDMNVWFKDLSLK